MEMMSVTNNLNSICRCCHTHNGSKNISTEHYHSGYTEIYENMLKDIFNVNLTQYIGDTMEVSRLICDDCILKLRAALAFKTMVVVNEKSLATFVESLHNRDGVNENNGGMHQAVMEYEMVKSEYDGGNFTDEQNTSEDDGTSIKDEVVSEDPDQAVEANRKRKLEHETRKSARKKKHGVTTDTTQYGDVTDFLHITTSDTSSATQPIDERNFVLLLLSLYREYPELWQVKNKDYVNKDKKNLAIRNIVNVLQTYKPDFDEHCFKKKINILRTNFNKECQKLEQKKQAGETSDECPPEPTLWYFNEIRFIKDQHDGDVESMMQSPSESWTPRPQSISLCLPPPPPLPPHLLTQLPSTLHQALPIQQPPPPPHQPPPIQQPPLPSHQPPPIQQPPLPLHQQPLLIQQPPPPPPPPPPQTPSHNSQEKRYQPAFTVAQDNIKKTSDPLQALPNLPVPYNKIPNDEAEIIAKGWVIKINRLALDQKLFAEKIINDALFEGEMGTLTRYGAHFLTSSTI